MIVFVVTALACEGAHANAQNLVSAGRETHFAVEIRGVDTGKLLYSGGKSNTAISDGMVSVQWFRDSDSAMMQTLTLDYSPRDFRMKTYRFDNIETGENSNIKIEKNRALVSHQSSSAVPVRDTTEVVPEGMISLEVLPEFIASKWSILEDGKSSFSFSLYITSRREHASFTARLKPSSVKGSKSHVVEVSPGSWFMKQFVPVMELELSKDAQPYVIKFTRRCPLRSGKYKDSIVDVLYKKVDKAPAK